MKLKQLVSIRDSIQKARNVYGSELSNDTKVDFDDTINFLNNIIDDAEKERKTSMLTRDHVIYQIRIELK